MQSVPAGDVEAARGALSAILGDLPAVAVAVSGGVDSMVLAALAHSVLGGQATMFHAASAAVPAEATERVERHAAAAGWQLRVIDAAELADPEYRRNPANRCFFCKTNLYAAIAARTSAPIVSGANLDDLGEYRPGLDAAREHGVRHPFVEARIGKPMIRALAGATGLPDLAGLPAAPCLSSRVETGIAIRPDLLAAIHAAERLVARRLPALSASSAVRCRVRAAGIVVELDPASLAALPQPDVVSDAIADLFRAAGIAGPVSFAPYRNGSAFLRGGHEA